MARKRSRLTPLARALRKSDNIAEGRMWTALRNRQQGGFKFHRSFVIGDYIADFACVDLNLVIELDGSQHVGDPKDLIRNAFMNNNGWSVSALS